MSSNRQSAAVKPVVLSARNRHLTSRFSFGVDEDLVAALGTTPSASRWLDRQLTPSRVSDPRGGQVAGWFPRLADAPGEAWRRVKAGERSGWDYGYDFCCYTMARKIVSTRQVHEVMTDFWSNLLYIPAGEDRSFPWRMDYDKVIRTYALTSFKRLLRAAVVHPAMSGWLNNNSNTKAGINENLGRELLELYTVGRPAGYDENDVKNSARLLTGFRVRTFDGYDASYDPSKHWTGKVTVLGFSHDNADADGRPALNAYLDYLAAHPATAKRIARRLCVRFVSDQPSDSIVASVAKAYSRSGTDIKATIRALVAHPEFVSAARKVRTPSEDVVASVRALGMRPTGAGDDKSLIRHLHWMATNLGQQPLSWPRPDGFPEVGTTWESPARVVRSWDIHMALAGNWWKSVDLVRPKPGAQLPTAWPRTFGELVDHQSRMLIGRPASDRVRAHVATTLGTKDTRSFAAASDISDWYWTMIRAAVLNHPEGMLR